MVRHNSGMAVDACPDPLPEDLQRLASTLAAAWLSHPARARVDQATCDHWRTLLRLWTEDRSFPLYIRKAAGNRGSIVEHVSGRHLVPVDNSVAHWALALALMGLKPALSDIRLWIDTDRIPVALALTKSEKAQAAYRHLLSNTPRVVSSIDAVEIVRVGGNSYVLPSLNALGWKVCHVEAVGIGRGDIRELPMDVLAAHFRRYLDPSNMFLVPKTWAGLGEMPEMIAAAHAEKNAAR